MYIWIFQKALAQRLAVWAWISIFLGILCFLPGSDFWAGMAFQFFAWALISLVIAGFGYFNARSRQGKPSLARQKSSEADETSSLKFVLQSTSILSLVFILGGLTLAFFKQAQGSFGNGAGLGIAIQGIFALWFSRYHLRKLK